MKLIGKLFSYKKGFLRACWNFSWKNFFSAVHVIFNGWSLFFHLFFLFLFTWVHIRGWYPFLFNDLSTLFKLMPFENKSFFVSQWSRFWALYWYFDVIFVLIWACFWVPDREAAWIKPNIPYWEWTNKTFLFFIPKKLKKIDVNFKSKFELIFGLIWLGDFFYKYLDFKHLGTYGKYFFPCLMFLKII